ncbi:DUF58 domain-containing protein [Plantibacter sp. Leaf314]|uniref:DUF58 domain-containing protein n=1 Tax=Plantibacter sp. Leaf314 TaxID=1736333 RepID=UPI0006FC795F|nr:DUF58 domain-containing protein [Plantibacter sp. Leaf314]KQQ49701.1 hypothetical protein ASF68_17880 [Plantibacter sp. Leaf314]
MRRRIPLTRRAVGVLVAAGVCLVFARGIGSPELLAAAGLLIALVAASFGAVYLERPSLRVDRTTRPDLVAVGGRISVEVSIAETSALPHVHTEWKDRIPSGLDGDASGTLPSTGVAGIGSRKRTAEYTVTALRRGQHELGPLGLAVSDPFGLVVRRRNVGGTHAVLVLPEVVVLPEIPALTASRDGSTRPSSLRAGAGEDDVIARPYLPGDAIRRLHWRASAHHGELMVRQEEQRNDPEATVLLDTAAAHWAWPDDDPSHLPAFEQAVSLAASITAHLVDAEYRVNLVGAGSEALSREVGAGSSANGLRSSPVGGMGDALERGGQHLEDDDLDAALLDLALLRPSHEPTRFLDLSPVISARRTQPVIAILGDVEEGDLGELTAVARLSPLPIALLPAGARRRTVELLELAGWRCHVGERGASFAALWLDSSGPTSAAGASRSTARQGRRGGAYVRR